MALATHPRRNSMYVRLVLIYIFQLAHTHNFSTALQFSLQNVADMLKVRDRHCIRDTDALILSYAQYVLTMILSRPSQFKIAAMTSFVSVVLGASTYLVYVKRERGHVLHHGIGDLIPLLKKTR